MTAAAALRTDARPLLAFGLLLLLLVGAGLPLESDLATFILCTLLLLVGLPHGALDIERLKQAQSSGPLQVAGLFLLYLLLAGLTFVLWQQSPVLAMGLFLFSAMLHFAEDWPDMPDPILALGMAAALLSAPALVHKHSLGAIFAEVTGAAGGALLAEILQTIAPVALALAMVGVIGLARKGFRDEALCCVVLLAAMLMAPPIAAFALFFCVYHSPKHLSETWRELVADRKRMLAISIALTGVALAIAVGLTLLEARGNLSSSLVAATFMTLSILTVPHMLAPLLVRWLR